MSLYTLNANETVKICAWLNLDAALRRKLQVLGIYNDCELTMKQKMLFKGLCVLEWNGHAFYIWHYDARKIEVSRGWKQ